MIPLQARDVEEGSRDRFSRPLHDLRISVTDRCNFRCTYCMPKELFGANYRFMPRSELLSFEEITRLAEVFVAHGVRKIRLTGGEPLLRQGLEELVRMLSAVAGLDDLTLTTNGSLLTLHRARRLRAAGLKRLTVSLDAVDDTVFSSMNDVGFSVEPVLKSIEEADRAGLAPIKINMVVKRGVNDHEIVPMAHGRRRVGARDHRHDRSRASLARGGAQLPRRSRATLALRGRRGRDRGHRIRHPAVLRGMHPCPPFGGG